VNQSLSNYTWCQKHPTPDTFDPAFRLTPRRSVYHDEILAQKAGVKSRALELVDEFVWFSVATMFSVLAIVLHAFTQSVRRVPSMYDQYMRRTIHEGMASEFDFDVVDSKTSTIVLLFSAAIIALLHIFVRDKQLENLLSLIIFLWYPTVRSIRVTALFLVLLTV
jgi:hypothetical protein